jgi:hypothetical protein
METPPGRDFAGSGIPTRREVGVGQRVSSVSMYDSILGIAITEVAVSALSVLVKRTYRYSRV